MNKQQILETMDLAVKQGKKRALEILALQKSIYPELETEITAYMDTWKALENLDNYPEMEFPPKVPESLEFIDLKQVSSWGESYVEDTLKELEEREIETQN